MSGVLLSLLLADAAPAPIRFEDKTSEAAISWVHRTGGSGRRYLVQTFGGGVLVLDYDADGLPDLFFINGTPLPGYDGPPAASTLYRNRGDGTFADVTEAAGLESSASYEMGGAAADMDNDGDPDLFVTAFGPDRLWRNNGDGTFTDVTAGAGIDEPLWSSSAAFFDLEGDGFLDLYVSRYLDYSIARSAGCRDALCNPQQYEAIDHRLYQNRGDGTFEDVSSEAGVAGHPGRGLGVVASDYDDDGDSDLYVANDTDPNFLWRNDGGRLVESGVEAGVAYNEAGVAEAGMGADWGDVDRDGLLDVIVTNFDLERNTLYRNLGGGRFADATSVLGLGDRSLTELGFGCELADLDNDGWLDLVVTNGHIIDNIREIQPNIEFAQRAQVFRNAGGRFEEVSEETGPALARPRVGRGLATLDFDRDGDLDLALANNGGPAEILANEGASASAWIELYVVGSLSNRDGVGARVEVETPGLRQVEELRAGSSYLSQSELVVHFGLGAADEARVTVRWPSGHVEALGRLPARRRYLAKEGQGVLGARP
jgi:hypothetical protein